MNSSFQPITGMQTSNIRYTVVGFDYAAVLFSIAVAVVFSIGAFPLHGTVWFGTAWYGTAQFGSVCISTAV